MLWLIRFKSVAAWISAELPFLYICSRMYVCLIPTCMKFNLCHTFQNLTIMLVGECLYIPPGLTFTHLAVFPWSVCMDFL